MTKVATEPHVRQADLHVFRAEVAAWFAALNSDGTASSGADHLETERAWLAKLGERGYAAPHVPREWGGGGYSMREATVIYEEWARAGAPDVDTFLVSLHHVPSTLLAVGTAEQQQRFIKDAVLGTVWCQAFSETGAGSDLAAIDTRAERVDGGWRIYGHKVWSSHADLADRCLLLARSEPGSQRHRGLTYFLLDMRGEGIDVRPIKQNTGHATYCEIYFDGAFVADEDVLGDVGDGWGVAQQTLAAERGPAGFDVLARLVASMDRMKDSGVFAGGPAASEFAVLCARCEAARSLSLDLIEVIEAGEDATPLTSSLKVAQSELLRDFTGFAALHGDRALIDPLQDKSGGYVSGDWFVDWLGSWSWTISGGTNEIQRSIIAERVLGMPRETRPAVAS